MFNLPKATKMKITFSLLSYLYIQTIVYICVPIPDTIGIG